MFDKSTAFQIINLVLKRDILPNLTDQMAKEQTAAIISLLKNLDANTIQNQEPFQKVNHALTTELNHLLIDLNKMSSNPQIFYFIEELTAVTKQELSEQSSWEKLNQLFSTIIQFVYQHIEYHSSIPEVRKIIRRQLDIERKTVY